MTKPLIPMGTSKAVLLLLLPAILCGLATGCGPQPAPGAPGPAGPLAGTGPQEGPGPQAGGPQAAPASQGGLIGAWRGTIQTGTLTIQFAADGQYIQDGVTNTGVQTMQAGPYQLVAPNQIIFTVTTWSPKSRVILVPCGIPNNPTCNVQRLVTYPKPPDSEYAYVFNGPNALTLTNQTGPVNLTRVAGQ